MATEAATNIQIIGAWASPFAMRPRIALNLKNVDYEYLEEIFAPKSELLLKSNPVHKKVPVMIHNNQPIRESLVILQYIDDVFTSGSLLLPSDPYDRAIARFWATYMDNTGLGKPKLTTLSGSNYIDETMTPGLYAWADRFSSNDAVKDFIPDTEKLMGYAKWRFGSTAK